MLQLSAYRLLDQIHEGIESIVFTGQRISTQEAVAIKVLRNEYPDARDRARIEHEYSLLRRLSELPSVVRVFGIERLGNRLAIVMDHFGEPLIDVIRRRPLSLHSALAIGIKLSEAIAGLHEHQVIHKDIKPHNILVSQDLSELRLIDFGIATVLEQETQRVVNPDKLEGTLAYISPEQTGRMNRVIDARSDLYSMGVTLYELLTGSLPFTTTDVMELVHCHLARTPAPLTSLNADIPEQVSQLVLKLLAKSADERYQTARGVQRDLEECLRQLTDTGTVAQFPLGRQDFDGKLRISQRLYGRTKEEQELLAAFGSARAGSACFLLISGYSGIGKTSLVSEVHKPIAQSGGYFASGKFDQLNRSVPYTPFIQAFRALIVQILSEQPAVLARWRKEMQAALGRNGRLLTELIPELELIVGAQPQVLALGPTEAQNRFRLLFQRFIRVFTKAEHPLVLFLDDLQWADLASLKLLQVIFTDPERGHLLLIGSYRENEVGPDSPLRMTLNALRDEGIGLQELFLKPLTLDDVTELLADTFHASKEEVSALGGVVHQKTQGNPFFLNQFLHALKRDGLLSMDPASAKWSWDVAQIAAAKVNENIADLITTKLKSLSPATQQILTLAACIGHEFTLHALAAAAGMSAALTAERLWPALLEGAVVPLSDAYRLHASSSSGESEERTDFSADLDVKYRFAHDHVQQAAYALLGQEQRVDTHLRLGQILLAQYSDKSVELNGIPRSQLFEILNHQNLGLSRFTDPAERLQLARRNLLAGQYAKKEAAYQASVGYLRIGIQLLTPEHWETEHQLMSTLHVECSDCEALVGNSEAANTLLETALAHAKTRLERAQLLAMRIAHLAALGRIAEALETGLKALPELGVHLPATIDAQKEALPPALMAVQAELGRHSSESLLALPELTDPEQRLALRILVEISAVAFFMSPPLFGLIVLRMVAITLQHGHSEHSSYAFMMYGILLIGLLEQFQEAYRLGRLALKLNDLFGNSGLLCKLYDLFTGAVQYYREGYAEVIELTVQGFQAGLESGDFAYANYNLGVRYFIRMCMGTPMRTVLAETEQARSFAERTKDVLSTQTAQLAGRIIAALEGRTHSLGDFGDAQLSEAQFIAELERVNSGLVLFALYVYKLQMHYLNEDYAQGHDTLPKLEAYLSQGMGTPLMGDYFFYKSLTMLQLHPGASAEKQKEFNEFTSVALDKLHKWSENCPENYLARHQILLAEYSRVLGEDGDAWHLYHSAISTARLRGALHHEALACELLLRFHLQQRQTKEAALYLQDALYAYESWGALAKVSQLRRSHPELLPKGAGPARESTLAAGVTRTVTATTTTQSLGSLDSTALVRASQALSGEISLDRLLEQLMRLVAESSGAQRCTLILKRGEELIVAAELSDAGRATIYRPPLALDQSTSLSPSIVRLVLATQQSLLLNDAAESSHAKDPYVVKHQPRSLLCMPLANQGAAKGALFLVNDLVAGAFDEQRIALLGVLCSQMAISIENAQVYSDLERVVAERTEQLRSAQERVVRLEKESTEVRMAGGFAHEMRNALTSARLLLAKTLAEDSTQQSLCVQNSDKLKELFLTMKGHIPAAVRKPVLSLLNDINRNEEIVDTALRSIDQALRRSLRITAMTLEYSRLGQERTGQEVVNIGSLVSSILSEMKDEFQSGEIAIETDISLGLCLIGRPIHYYSIFKNLILNAKDAVLDKPNAADRQIQLQVYREEQNTIIVIADTGSGIAKENLNKIFEPFFSTKPATGTGLGLGIVRKLVGLYEGQIEVQSEVDKGTTFKLKFPSPDDADLRLLTRSNDSQMLGGLS